MPKLIYGKEQRPSILYKYAPLDKAKLIISDRTLKFEYAQNFNDPFDCDIDLLDFTYTGELSPEVQRDVRQLMKQYPFVPAEKIISAYRPTMEEKLSNITICCFSIIHDNIPMWSHYSNKHNGVCFEFDNSSDHRFTSIRNDDISEGIMNYHFKGRINYLSGARLDVITWWMLNKSKDWEYEKEYRMWLLSNKIQYQGFHPRFLKAVYFGVKVTEHDRREFIELCQQNGFDHLKFYVGEKHDLTLRFKEN